MSELLPGRSFDRQERGRIRSALRRYMEESRIGTPTLRYQIVRADVPRHRHLPLSTLQRFLADRHHTQDHHVELCHAFVKDLPYYAEGHDITQLGMALFEFLNVQLEAAEEGPPVRGLVSDLAGSYDLYVYPTYETLRYPPREMPKGALTLTSLDRQPCLHAREIVYIAPDAREAQERRHASEGAVVVIASSIYMLLRNCLTRQPRLCYLARRASPAENEDMKILEGETLVPEFTADMLELQGMAAHRLVQFVSASSAGNI